jgi:polynucleotide 5'-kinase involved in rRNA processing
VGYLDTDVGQPEFSPPGCLSFHVVDEALTGDEMRWHLCAGI